ncbi:SMC-Scp complex subunit ScpB [Clostridium pasteurianum]|uniref:Segregation and condensation protein B n=1 Tax=Clostridium pasteurianum BC1 TaxID=86416 RepID=R4KD73_CLOPA|nr:SMC-Scp complex subunit ScpB [Clostridium pasteurianum]AGK97560.1 segregation and condensation protein B [Clostridium pasteurianum BC1]
MKKYSIDQLEINEISNKNEYFSIIESLLFVSGEPLNLKNIADIIQCDLKYTNKLLKEMAAIYEDNSRGIKLISIDDNYQLVTKPHNSEYIEKLLKTNKRQSLSQASLEALAIIAYKQPVTRIDIDEIRGVKSDRAIVSLHEKNLIKECGRLEAPGRPILYGTTEEFLRYFNLSNLEELPSLDNFVDSFKDITEEDEI